VTDTERGTNTQKTDLTSQFDDPRMYESLVGSELLLQICRQGMLSGLKPNMVGDLVLWSFIHGIVHEDQSEGGKIKRSGVRSFDVTLVYYVERPANA
jgi:hypothetical protein